MRPNFAIIEERKDGPFTILTIDTTKATYQGVPWRSLGDFGKRKFENLLFMRRNQERLKTIYV